MAVNFDDLRPHVGHKLTCELQEDERAGIEDSIQIVCVQCDKVLEIVDKEDDCEEEYVYCLTITHPHGSEFFVFKKEETAREQLYAYVGNNWLREFPGESISEDKAEAISDYFQDNEAESYTLVEQPVLCEIEL